MDTREERIPVIGSKETMVQIMDSPLPNCISLHKPYNVSELRSPRYLRGTLKADLEARNWVQLVYWGGDPRKH